MKQIVLIFGLFISIRALSQTYKYQLSAVEVIMKDKDGEYLYHIDWQPCNIMISWDLHTRIVTVKGDSSSTFTVLGAQQPYLDTDSNMIVKFTCITDDNKKFGWRIINLVNPVEGWRDFMKMEYGQFALVYRMKEIE